MQLAIRFPRVSGFLCFIWAIVAGSAEGLVPQAQDERRWLRRGQRSREERAAALSRAQRVLSEAIPNSRLLGNSGLEAAKRILQTLQRVLDPVRSSAQVSYNCGGAWTSLPAIDFAVFLAEDSVTAYMHTLPAARTGCSGLWDLMEFDTVC